MASCEKRATRLQLAGSSALLLLFAGATLGATLWSSDVPFLLGGDGADWIGYPRPAVTHAIPSNLTAVPALRFSKTFQLKEARTPLTVEVRALRGFELRLNERPLASRDWRASGWKRRTSITLEEGLRAGENLLEVDVRNPFGPALLHLELDGPGIRIGSDETWAVAGSDGRSAGALRADDTRPNRRARGQPSTVQVLREHRDSLLFWFVACALVYLATRGRLPTFVGRRFPEIALVGIVAFWLYLFAAKFTRLPVTSGFDAPAHLDYVRFLLEQRSLPLASDGWSMYHPPLFYALSAGALTLFGAGVSSPEARWILRLVPFLAGVGQVLLTYALARRVFPGDPVRTSVAVLFAGLLPMNVYTAAYVSNESLHGFLAGAALLVTCWLLLCQGSRARWTVLLGGVIGLALLTKITTFVLLPGILATLAAKRWIADGAPPPRAAASVVGVVAVAATVAGWFYLRNQLELGQPLVGNWNVPGQTETWWQSPGFHRPGYYLSFGASLVRPFFSAFHSFWDGLYASFWGDGLVAGIALEGAPTGLRQVLRDRAWLWNYDFMAIGYVLALPATGCGALGFLRLARNSFRGSDLRRRWLNTFLTLSLLVMGFAVFWMTLRLPYYAQAKAFYALAMVGPLALTFAEGFAAVRERLERHGAPWLGALLYGWGGTFAVFVALSLAA
jgi:4-amino-4-deoxy-L-arabinose transferase-like glycosyltransferase